MLLLSNTEVLTVYPIKFALHPNPGLGMSDVIDAVSVSGTLNAVYQM